MADILGENGNGQTGIQGPEAKSDQTDKTKKFIVVTEDGWITARINLERGFYDIVGFLKEVEDTIRGLIVQQKKKEQEKSLVKPGWRGFSPFGKR